MSLYIDQYNTYIFLFFFNIIMYWQALNNTPFKIIFSVILCCLMMFFLFFISFIFQVSPYLIFANELTIPVIPICLISFNEAGLWGQTNEKYTPYYKLKLLLIF